MHDGISISQHSDTLRILHLEDDRHDAELIRSTMINSGLLVDVQLVSERADFERLAGEDDWSVILCDMSLPDYDGNRALKFVRQHAPEIPFIFVTGEMGEDVAIETLRFGATDYVLKGRLNALVPAVSRAVEASLNRKKRRLAEEALHKNQRRLDSLYRLAMMDRESEDEIITYALEECIALTDSTIGYLHFISEDQKHIERTVWSRAVLEHSQQPLAVHTIIREESVWAACIREGRPVIQNNFEQTRAHSAVPQDHLSMTRHLCMPIMEEQAAVLVVGVGNKEGEYEFSDVRLMQLMLVELWQILKRRRAQVELQTLSRALEFSPASIIITDPDGTIEYVNPKAEEITGYSSAELLGENPRILSSGMHSKVFYDRLWQTITSGHTWKGEIFNRRKDSTFYWEQASIAPVRDHDGVITHFVAVKEDISMRKEAELAHAEALEEARRASGMKDCFVGMISHEIRTPLNIILGFTGLLQEEYAPLLPEENQFYFEAINEAGTRLARTVDLTLNLSALETGVYKPKIQQLDIHYVTEAVVQQFVPAARSKNLYIELHVDGDDLTIEIDVFGYEQALMHLLENAIKYTTEGGVFVGLYQKAQGIQVEIRDTGVGMDSETLKTIFAPFSQAESGYNRKYEGVGIGLTLAQRYINLAGGTLHGVSEPGQGSCFHITLPVEYRNGIASMNTDARNGNSAMHTTPKYCGGSANDARS